MLKPDNSMLAVNVSGQPASKLYVWEPLTSLYVISELFVLQNKKATVYNEDELLHQMRMNGIWIIIMNKVKRQEEMVGNVQDGI